MAEKRKSRRPASRRDFLKATAAAAAASVVGTGGCRSKTGKSPKPKQIKPPPERKTGEVTVVLVRDENATDEKEKTNAKVVKKMLEQAVTTLTGKPDAKEAWKSLLNPNDRLGIKTNEWGYLRTPPALERTIEAAARSVGIPKNKIVIDDRGARRTLLDCTALINARPLRSHHWSGLGGLLKNYIMFVDNPSAYHPVSCADLGALWNLPVVKGKTRLNILVMLTPLFHGRGPHHFSDKYIWRYNGLLVSTDPVAADTVGREILRAKRLRHFGRHRPFSIRTHHIDLADTRHHVGVADLKRINIVKLGWKKDLLLKT